MRGTKAAFYWIISILKKYEIPFQISGGLAAKIYGVRRELVDIDIDVPEEQFKEILPKVKNYIIFGPRRYKDADWDLWLMTLCYKGQNIDIAGAHQTKIFNKNTKQWIRIKTNFSTAEIKEIFGMKVPVISKKDLIKYKKKLRREVDLTDLRKLGGV